MMLNSLINKKIWVAGHNGMVGSALVRRLENENCTILKVSRKELDLRKQAQTEEWLKQNQPEIIFLAAAKVGGILANATYPAEFLYDNLLIESNVIHAAYKLGIKKLIFLGSSCIYPKYANQPIQESELLTGSLEPTNESYAIAKIAGIKLCQAYHKQYGCDFISVMPTNLYGLGDLFDAKKSHVVPALILKIHEAKMRNYSKVILWGTGTARREFLFVDDLADAVIHLCKSYSSSEIINIGTGIDYTILELAEMIAKIVEYKGSFEFDTTKPDGTPRKLLDVSKLQSLGWSSKISLNEGLQKTYKWFLCHYEKRSDMVIKLREKRHCEEQSDAAIS